MDLNECKLKGYVKKAFIDKELIKSLIEMADASEVTVNTGNINEITISSYVSTAYDSLRQVLEALSILNGYKVTNHVCLGELLVTLLKEFNYEIFDRFRYIRNGISYYGKKVELEQGKELIKKILKMKNEMLELLKKELAKTR